MWRTVFQAIVVALIIVAVTLLVFLLGFALCANCRPAPAATTPVVTATPASAPQDATLQAINRLSAKMDANRREDNGRFQVIDERLKRLEYGRPAPPAPQPPPPNPCDGWSEETVPPMQ